MKKLIFTLMIFGTAVLGHSQEFHHSLSVNGAYYFPSAQGLNTGSWFSPPGYTPVENPQDPTPAGEEDAFGGWGGPGAQVLGDWSWKYPVLVGEGPLMEGNNLSLGITADLTPVTALGSFQAVLTPLAVLQLRTGVTAATGWSVLGLAGLGSNIDGKTLPGSFSGALLKAHLGATFQFDLGAVVPGDWTHVLTLADIKAEYQDFTGADADTPWYWQVDAGENFDGLQLVGTYFLGWQMPAGMPLGMVGILTTSQTWLRDVPGEDYVKWETGPLAQFITGEGSTLTVLLQMKTRREYTAATAYRTYFLDRTYKETVFEPSQLAFSWTLKIK